MRATPRLSAILATVSLALCGCSDPIIGNWTATEISDEPLPFSVQYEDCLFTFDEARLEIDEDLEGDFRWDFDYDCDSAGVGSDTLRADVEVELPEKQTEHILTFSGDLEGELTCSLDADRLRCEDDEGFGWIFELDE